MDKETLKHVKPLYDFAIHILVGAAIFALVALAAVKLGEFITWLDIPKEDHFIEKILQAIKFAIFGIDCILFGIFLLRSTIITAKKLWNH